MCIFPKTPDVPDPVIASETAAAKMPDAGAVSGAGNKQRNQLRAAAATVLTSGSGVRSSAPTQSKTLLGQ